MISINSTNPEILPNPYFYSYMIDLHFSKIVFQQKIEDLILIEHEFVTHGNTRVIEVYNTGKKEIFFSLEFSNVFNCKIQFMHTIENENLSSPDSSLFKHELSYPEYDFIVSPREEEYNKEEIESEIITEDENSEENAKKGKKKEEFLQETHKARLTKHLRSIIYCIVEKNNQNLKFGFSYKIKIDQFESLKELEKLADTIDENEKLELLKKNEFQSCLIELNNDQFNSRILKYAPNQWNNANSSTSGYKSNSPFFSNFNSNSNMYGNNNGNSNGGNGNGNGNGNKTPGSSLYRSFSSSSILSVSSNNSELSVSSNNSELSVSSQGSINSETGSISSNNSSYSNISISNLFEPRKSMLDLINEQICPPERYQVSPQIQKVIQNNLLFIDASFYPITKSIYGKNFLASPEINALKNNQIGPNSDTSWKSAKAIKRGIPKLFTFRDGINVDQIKQGEIGDCWILACLVSLATEPYFIRKIFLSKEINEAGIYELQFCIDGEWKRIVIDSFLPVKGEKLWFCHNNSQAIWPMLVEKAFAKLYGSYFDIHFGSSQDSFRMLTGYPTITIDFSKKNFKKGKKGNKYSIGNKGLFINDEINEEYAEKYLEMFTHYLQTKKYKMVAISESNEEELSRYGLKNNHFYSVLDIKSYKQSILDNSNTSRRSRSQRSTTRKFRKIDLVLLHNPWGYMTWNGPFGNNSSEWEYGILKAKFKKKEIPKGAFYIPFKSFLKYFVQAVVCKTNRNCFEYRKKITVNKNEETPTLKLCVHNKKQRTKLIIGLHQKTNIFDFNSDFKYYGLGIAVYSLGIIGNLGRKKLLGSPKILKAPSVETDELSLKRGKYEIEPITFRDRTLESQTYVISVHSDQPISLDIALNNVKKKRNKRN